MEGGAREREREREMEESPWAPVEDVATSSPLGKDGAPGSSERGLMEAAATSSWQRLHEEEARKYREKVVTLALLPVTVEGDTSNA